MPTFEIPDGPTSVDVPRPSDPKSTAPAEAAAVYNVTNKSSESASGSLVVEPTEPAKLAWFTIDGEQVRNFGPGETQTANVKIKIPADVTPGDYKFQLLAAATSDTDNDVAKGPMTTAVLKGAEVKKKSLWWLWILLGLLALAIIGGALWYFLSPPKPGPTPDPPALTVPNFVDKTVDQAKAEPQGFSILETAGSAAGKPPRTIVSQAPAAGGPTTKGAVINVTFDPGVTVPSIVGQDVATAVRTLQRVTLHVERSTSRCERSGVADQIVDQEPKAGAVVTANGGVNITVRTIGNVFLGRAVRCGRPIPLEVMRTASPMVARPIRIEPR